MRKEKGEEKYFDKEYLKVSLELGTRISEATKTRFKEYPFRKANYNTCILFVRRKDLNIGTLIYRILRKY